MQHVIMEPHKWAVTLGMLHVGGIFMCQLYIKVFMETGENREQVLTLSILDDHKIIYIAKS